MSTIFSCFISNIVEIGFARPNADGGVVGRQIRCPAGRRHVLRMHIVIAAGERCILSVWRWEKKASCEQTGSAHRPFTVRCPVAPTSLLRVYCQLVICCAQCLVRDKYRTTAAAARRFYNWLARHTAADRRLRSFQALTSDVRLRFAT